MALVVTGRLNKQVAESGNQRKDSQKTPRGRVMQKMNAESLADLVNMAAKLRLGQQLAYNQFSAVIPAACLAHAKFTNTNNGPATSALHVASLAPYAQAPAPRV